MGTRSSEKSEVMGNATALESSKIRVNHLIGFSCASLIEPLSQAGDDYGHVVGLFGPAGPFLGGGHERLGDNLPGGTLHVNSGLLQVADAEFLSIHVLRFNQAVPRADEQRIRGQRNVD